MKRFCASSAVAAVFTFVASIAGAEPPDQGKLAGVGQPVFVGDIKVEVCEASVHQWSENKKLLKLFILVSTSSKTKKYAYSSWSKTAVPLVDNHDNKYPCHAIKNDNGRPIGQKGDDVRPDDPLIDVLHFDVPINAAEYVDLRLPAAKALGRPGEFCFRIPATAWQAVAKPALPPKTAAPATKPIRPKK